MGSASGIGTLVLGVASPFAGKEAVGAGLGRGGEPGERQGGDLREAERRLADQAGETVAVFDPRLDIGVEAATRDEQGEVTGRDADGDGEIDLTSHVRRESHHAAAVLDELEQAAEGGRAHDAELFHGAAGEVPRFRVVGEFLGAARKQQALEAEGGHAAGDGREVPGVGDAVRDDDAFAAFAPFGEIGDACQAGCGAHGQGAHVGARSVGRLREFHRAERDGLCDTGSGGRHPFGAVLRDKAPEPEFPGAFAGVDLAGLEKEAADHPDHCGIAVRLARRYELPVTEKLEAAALTVVLDDTQRRAIEKAVAGYGVALTHNPECWPALFRTGELLLILDKPAEAATFLDKAANAFPVYVPAWLDLAVAWARAGDPKRAGEALAAFGARTDVLKGTTQFLDASRFSAPDSFKAVADVLADAAARVPNNALLPAHLALVRFRAGDIEGARSAALLAEKNGLVGRNALPHPALLEVHGIKVPVAASSDR